jgi:hypothetical protein
MHLELFLVRVLVPYVPVVGVLWVFFFSPRAPEAFLREGYTGYVTLCRILVMLITFFLFSVRGLDLLPFGGVAGALLQLQWGVLVSVHC